MKYRTALLFVWLRLMGCDCSGPSTAYTVTEFESNEPVGETLEIYFSNDEELADELKKHQQYFYRPDNSESCKIPRVTTIATSLTSRPVFSPSSSPEDGTTTKPGPDKTSESTSSPLTTLSFAATTETQDIDECLNETSCHEYANCTNFPFGYNCSCKAGFTGNGTLCTDIDECSDGNACHKEAHCTNFLSSYNCSCKAGFTGNGSLCTDIDECLNENSCHECANCINFPSSYNCSCKTGFTVNGRPCKDTTLTTQEETIEGCAYIGKHETCNITYEGKCFILWNSGNQNVDLQTAIEYCEKHGFQLGNIYDGCLFSQILNHLDHDKPASLWTGMTVVLEQSHQVYLHSNKTSKFQQHWWYEGYPKDNGSKNLQILIKLKVISPPPSYQRGITNAPANTLANGALCEKNVDE